MSDVLETRHHYEFSNLIYSPNFTWMSVLFVDIFLGLIILKWSVTYYEGFFVCWFWFHAIYI